jgi:hypothetical protein
VTPDDLDRLLSEGEHLLPSSGFAASVMEQIQREAAAPPALPFPWTRAIPGFVALAIAMAAAIWAGVGAFDDPEAGAALEGWARVVLDGLARPEVGWTALAAVMTIVPAMVSLRLIRRRV